MKHLKALLRGMTMLFIVAFSLSSFWSMGQQTSQEVTEDYCFSDQLLNESLIANPDLQHTIDDKDNAIINYLNSLPAGTPNLLPSSGGGSGSANYIIPVVVYIVHNNGVENITDQQIHSQIDKLNAEFSPHNISFCLATEENGSPLPGTGPDPGIIRIQSSLTNHLTSAEATLKNLSPLPAARYLRIWVVKDINSGSGILGYARFPGTVTPNLEGIVMRYDAFGDVATCGCSNLIPSNDQGKVLAHEVGHYLDLYHTFQGGCSGGTSGTCATQGDKVCDTPPVATANSGCPTLGSINSCSGTGPDLLDNHMDYTNDNCRNNFTNGQEDRMVCAINLFRSTLVSGQNLVYTGVQCNGGLFAAMSISNYTPCNNTSITFTANTVLGATYTWDFGDGNTATGNPVTHSYITGNQNYSITLTINDGTNTVSEVQNLFVSDCSPISSSQGNWYFYEQAGLDFSSGTPVADDAAWMNGSQTAAGSGSLGEGCISISNNSGDLLFLSNAMQVWDENHNLINPGNPLLGGSSAANGIVSVPDPGNANRHYIFTCGASSGSSSSNGLRYSIVQISVTAASTTGTWNVPITFPSGLATVNNGAVRAGEGITAIASCDGYWIITTARASSGSQRYVMVYEVTSGGVSFVSQFAASKGAGFHPVKASPDGSKIAITEFIGVVGTHLYDFDKFSGTVSNEVLLTSSTKYGCSFSPNSQLLYVSDPGGSLYQYNVAAASPASTEILVSAANLRSLQIGPDGKIYAARHNQTQIGVIHQPDNLCTNLNPNACNFTSSGPLLNTLASGTNIHCTWGLPNMVDANTVEVFDNTISCDISNCFTYTFTANYCGSTFIWDFGDMTGGIGASFTHTYASAGTYTVTLTIDGSTTVTKTITVGINSAIAGPTQVCLDNTNVFNYSAVVSGSGLIYNWSASGGTIGINGNDNVDVSWSTLPGTLTLTVTDPVTGCTSTSTITVTEDCEPCDVNPNYYIALGAKDPCLHLFNDATVIGPGCTITSWHWDFGDGTTSNLQNPVHAFPTNGTYNVCLTVTVICNGETCVETICQKVPVEYCDPCEDLRPNYYVAISAKDRCTMIFTDATPVPFGCTITSWFWDFGDGTTSTLQNPWHTFPGNGNYNVCLTVTMQCGRKICQETFCMKIPVEYCKKDCEVNPQFYPAISIKNPCTVLFSNATTVGSHCTVTGWFWDFGDGTTSTSANPSHTYSADGVYIVCLTVTAQCGNQICIEKICYPVYVYGCSKFCDVKPDYLIAIDPDLCTFYFSDNSNVGSGCSITAWHWDFGDGTTSSLQNPSHTYTANGSYSVCLTITADCNGKICTETTCYSVLVNGCNPCPCGIFPNFSESITSCTVDFNDLTLTNGCTQITGYFWDFGDGTTSTSANPSHTYASSGTYVVCLTVYGNNGYESCVEKFCKEITVNCIKPCPCDLKPFFNFSETNCVVTFSDQTTHNKCTSLTNWYWDFGDGTTSTLQNPVHTYASPGVYTVCLTVEGTNGTTECKKTYCMQVEAQCHSCPCGVTSNFTFNQSLCDFKFYDQSTTNICSHITGWYWDFGDGTTSTAQNPFHTYSSPGTYVVCLVTYASNGTEDCKDRYCFEVEACRKSAAATPPQDEGEELKGDKSYQVNLYPNPFSNQLNITIGLEKDEKVSITAYDSYGKRIADILDDDLSAGEHTIQWSPSRKSLASGMYFIAIKTEKGFEYRKVTFTP